MGSNIVARVAVFAVVALGLLAGPAAAKKSFTVKNCTPAGTSELKAAHAFIKANLEAILKDSGLKEKHKKKVRKQWDTVKAVCVDEKRACKKEKMMGRAHGILTNRVSICYAMHYKYDYCELVDTLFHEAGHTFNLGTGRIGHKKGDRIYTMGAAAKAVCKAKGANRPVKQ